VSTLPENTQRRVLQQHDGLGIHDAAVADHGQRLVNRKFQHFDALALKAIPAPAPIFMSGSYSVTEAQPVSLVCDTGNFSVFAASAVDNAAD
jgi:hypothetical protein